jgi:hypothetical protein
LINKLTNNNKINNKTSDGEKLSFVVEKYMLIFNKFKNKKAAILEKPQIKI